MDSHYSIARRHDGWVIFVDCRPVLVCESEKTAREAVRRAAGSPLSSGAAAAPPSPAPG